MIMIWIQYVDFSIVIKCFQTGRTPGAWEFFLKETENKIRIILVQYAYQLI